MVAHPFDDIQEVDDREWCMEFDIIRHTRIGLHKRSICLHKRLPDLFCSYLSDSTCVECRMVGTVGECDMRSGSSECLNESIHLCNSGICCRCFLLERCDSLFEIFLFSYEFLDLFRIRFSTFLLRIFRFEECIYFEYLSSHFSDFGSHSFDSFLESFISSFCDLDLGIRDREDNSKESSLP